MALLQRIARVQEEALAALQGASDSEALEKHRRQLLGPRGELRALFRQLGAAEPAERAEAGKALNKLKKALEARFQDRLDSLGRPEAARSEEAFDYTQPGLRPRVGSLHPVYCAMKEIVRVLGRLGFTPVYGPELENEYNNFEALNIPLEHPSRDAFDVFYLEGGDLLRSHTSPVQIRVMQKLKPPIRVVAPGKVMRPDAVDACHAPVFHQVEGLLVEEGVSFADLKGVLTLFLRQYFGEEARTRFRPSFFPFTEPSAEVDVSCVMCRAKGCPLCGGSGWLEILGAGMVHPQVLSNVDLDPDRYTGFAFGMGVERIAMLRYQIPDIRLFCENQVRFLEQFP